MADCPYARCIQERRHIRRELLRWTKNMVFVVGLERVAEELMGRRRWKQYQDTLYSGSRSINESSPGEQPHHHRLYPPTTAGLPSGCNPIGPVSGQIGPHHVLAPVTTAPTTSAASIVAPLTSPTTPNVGPLKQEHHQRLPNHQQHPLELQQQQRPDDLRRLRPENIKIETEEDDHAGGPAREDALTVRTGSTTTTASTRSATPVNATSLPTATTTGNATTTTTTTATAIVATRRRPRRLANDGETTPERAECEGDVEEEGERQEEEAEKRLKLDEDLANSSVSPLRAENDRPARDQPATNATDTEGTKERTEETALERIPVTQGLLRVKKEEELQEPSVVIGSASKVPESSAEGSRPGPEAAARIGGYLLGHRHASPPPEDWKPLDKCYFCLDGKLPHDDQPPLSPQSDSSSSSRSAESPMSAVQVDPMAASVVAAALGVGGTYPTLLHQWVLPPRESQMPGMQVHQDAVASADQPLDLSAKPKNSQDNNISLLEQQKIPLRMPAGIDHKSIFNSCYRAKPRMTGTVPRASAAAVAAAAAAAAAAATGVGVGVGGVPAVVGAGGGRRTYTEEELQAALRDIQNGKLGTRRAAVIYGIPRSTLRNKVYKLALERERDASLTSTHSHPHEPGAPATTTTTIITTTTTTTTTPPNTTQNASATTPPPQVDEFNTRPLQARELARLEVDDKELSGAEEEKEVEKALRKPLLSLDDLVRFYELEGAGGESLRTLLQRGQEAGAEWTGLEPATIGPYIQKMLAAAMPFKGLEMQDYRIPEVMRRLMSEDKRLSKSVNGDQPQAHHHAAHHHPPQAPPAHHQQAQQQPATQQQQQQSSRGPMTNDDFNPAIEEEASDSAQGRAILKIPSYKPTSAASTPGCSGKNGEPTSAAFAQGFAAAAAGAATPSPGLLERASPAFSGTSSPTNSLVGKTVAVNFRDVIAKSISVKFQESQPQAGAISAAGMPGCQPTSGVVTPQPGIINEPSPFKRGRYTPPQPPAAVQPAQPAQQQQPASKQQTQEQNKPKPGTGGKGTRPKRGKYRNYDRDSLVEAVRAVQRGEMSVHRAGSYYGVPHSTLEYKVKERHLMRPRKRDQKQPDDKAKEPGATSAAVGAMRPGATDKTKAPLKPQKPFAAAAPAGMPGPNGLKMPPFMEGMTHLPFPPFNFWNPPPFMPTPFMASAPTVPSMLSEQYFATQRMRGLQEQQRNAAAMVQQHQQRDRDGNGIAVASGASESASTSSSSRGGGAPSMVSKTPRDMAESLYDGTGANGSFLDNLIRSSLERGIPRDQQRVLADARGQQTSGSSSQQQGQQQAQHPETMSSKSLIDQLCRNSGRTPLPRMTQDSSEDESYRAPGTGRSLPERPERVPTVDLSPSPSERARTEDGSDRLTSPPTPLSVSRAGSRDEDSTRDSRIDRSSREREVHNGGQEDRERKNLAAQQQQLNNYPDLHNLYVLSTDKKSACDSKLIIDPSSQKTQQPQQQQQTKEYATVGGLVVQLQRGYNAAGTAAGATPAGAVRPEQPQTNSNQQTSASEQRAGPAAVLAMEDSVEQ